ncbi:MAG TPA: CU044_2847 family protein [Candidatus Deferrimicrobium sp.]|nr:CU044_2847 family protein [Candidatus Deferrimicrobium sp.]
MAIIKTTLSDGTELMIETSDGSQEKMPAGYDEYRSMSRPTDKIFDSGKNLFREAILRMQVCAAEIAAGINEIKETAKPDEVEASLAFKLTAEAGAVITKLCGEAHLQVKLAWKNDKNKRSISS